jgi:hypothetical protein
MNRPPLKFSFFLFLALLSGVPEAARADLAITPTIVVIEGRNRYADINLINTGDKPVTYDMNWRFMQMVEGKMSYKTADASLTDFDLSKNSVFTPRKVTLEPKIRQKIRIALRLKGEPPAPGDYRAHMEFVMGGAEALKEKQAKTGAESVGGPHKTVVGVGIRVGYSIPVIYRVGESNVRAEIGSVTTQVNKAGKLEANVELSRTEGPYGVIGHLYIYHVKGGEQVKIGEIANANIFPEIRTRVFTVPLSATSLTEGQIHLVLKNALKGREQEVLTEKTISIQ